MLFPHLQPFFTENGFQSAVESGIFRCERPEARLTVAISEHRQTDGYLAELHLGIHHVLVEQIIYPFALGMLAPGDAAYTIWVSQTQIDGVADREEWLRDESDAKVTAHRWQQWMQEKGFAWLDIYRQTTWLDQLYNDTPDQVRYWQPDVFLRGLRAVALAYLAQRPDFRSVVQRCKRELAAAGEAELLLRLDGLVSALP